MGSSKVVYLSGKMTGKQDFGRRKFAEVEERLTSMGYIVLNPARLPIGMDDNKYMPICLAMIDSADIVYMLRGFNDSDGARIEQEYAAYQGKWIVYEIFEVWEEE